MGQGHSRTHSRRAQAMRRGSPQATATMTQQGACAQAQRLSSFASSAACASKAGATLMSAPVAWWSAVLAVLLAPSSVFAQTRDDDSETLDRIQVTASALPTTAATASQHITILRREQLDALRGLSVSEILAAQAGVVVDRGPRSGGFGALYLRGADPSHVVILVDHVRQNDPLSSRGSAVDLNALSGDDIERIEIVRGNASVVNADAMAGLIHIFTRRGSDALGAYAGGDGLRGAQASLSGDALRASVAQREEGSRDADDRDAGFYRVRAANAAWEQAFGDKLRVQLAGRYADSLAFGFADDSGGARYAVLRKLDSRRGDSRQFSLRVEADAGASQWQVQAASATRRSDDRTPGVAPGLRDPFGLPALDSRGEYRRDELQAVWRRGFGEAWMLTAGGAHQREVGRLDSAIDLGFFVLPADFELRRRTSSVFAEARWQREAWTLQGGVRVERSSDAGHTRHPMLSLQRTLQGGGQWGASFARSAKQPSFYALAHPLVGNPELDAERASHRELYYASAADGAWPLRLTLFSARYQDLIDFESGPPPRLVNRARIESDGLEWRIAHRFDNEAQLQFEGAWMRLRGRDDDGSDVVLRHRPRLQAAVSAQWPLAERRALHAGLRYLGRRFDSSIPTGDRWLAPAAVLDLGLAQSFGAADLMLALDNVFDRRVEETIGSESGGRRLRLSLQWRLP